jgi:hypothetical protein
MRNLLVLLTTGALLLVCERRRDLDVCRGL